MSGIFPFHDKDLALLPAPKVIEEIDYESLFAERSATFNALHPLLFEDGQPVFKTAELVQTETEAYWKVPVNSEAALYYLDLESDPSTRHNQADVYREMLLRKRVNEAALSTMPAYATGSDLDHIGLRYYGISRLSTGEGGIENDAAYLKRMLLSPEGLAKGGSDGWYIFHALSADGNVKDVRVISPEPCHITIIVLSHSGDGTASSDLLDIVREKVTGHYAFPQGDLVTVQSAEIVHYSVSAMVQMYPGPSASPVIEAIKQKFTEYRVLSERISHWVDEDGIFSALKQPGVYRTKINTPTLFPLEITNYQASFCDSFDVQEGVVE